MVTSWTLKGWERNHVTEKPRQQKSLEEQDCGLPGVPDEDEQIEAAVCGSPRPDKAGLHHKTPLCREVVVQGNPKVYKAPDSLPPFWDELRRAEDGAGVDDELLDTIQMIAAIMGGMKEV